MTDTTTEPTPTPAPTPLRPRATFQKHERINDPKDFRRAFDRKRSAADPNIVVYGVENGLDYARLGISVSRKKIRRATGRNRFKRLVREAFRLSKAELPAGLDLVVVPRGANLTFEDARRSLPALAQSVAKRIGLRTLKAVP
jgi:ribonuclease P protein component